MNKNTIDVKTGILFPWPFLFLAVILLIVSVSLIAAKTVVAIVLAIGSMVVLSGYSGIEIDTSQKVYREYMSFLFIKSGKKISYDGIEKIFINTSKVRRQMFTAHTTKSSIYSNVEFNGYLKFDDGTKVHLLSKRQKEKLIKHLNKIAAVLQVQIEDNTASV